MQNPLTKLNIVEIGIPLLCTGTILMGVILFLYVYYQWKNRLYLAMVLLSFTALLFVFFETLVAVISTAWDRPLTAFQFHRLEQVACLYFLFCLPFFLSELLDLSERRRKTTRFIAYAGLGIALVITILAYAAPDLFISQTRPSSLQGISLSWTGRGQQGPAYIIRDILLAAIIVYSLILTIADLARNRQFRYILPILIGMILGILGAIDDSLHIHRGAYPGLFPFPAAVYSRFAIGITLFVLFSMIGINRKFLDQAKDVENAYAALHTNEERLTEIASNINEVVWLIDYRTQKLLYINPAAFTKIWEQDPEKLYDSFGPWFNSIHKDDQEYVRNEVVNIRRKNKYEVKYRIVMPDNRVKWIRERVLPLKNGEGTIRRVIRVSEDITIPRLVEQELMYIAYHDQLTGLQNRQSFYDKFIVNVIKTKDISSQKMKGLLFIDLDYFKNINDAMSHKIGDDILKQVAGRIQSHLRSDDAVFRIGGDEFIVILNNLTSEKDAGLVAEKIIHTVSEPFTVRDHVFHIGISIGITIYPRDGEDVETLMKNLDTTLTEAKKEKNTYKYFTQEIREKALQKIRITNDLREALSRNEFVLHYQPLINIHGKITGAEALIRWKHPEMGLVAPMKFIPVAEETGLIIPIGNWVLETACSVETAWKRTGLDSLYISINLSMKQFKDRELVRNIEAVLEKTEVDPSRVHLELTESVLMENVDETVRKLKILGKKGVKFSIDDFGTGYSSLSTLKNFPLNILKIDKSFISGIPHRKEDTALVKAIISMGHELGLQVIAEGVETREQLDYLCSLQCNEIQGFFYSKALPQDQFVEYVRKMSHQT